MEQPDTISPELFDHFHAAVEHVNVHSYTNGQRAKFYGLYKVVTLGQCTEKRPPIYRLRAFAKHSAWKSKSHLTASEAMSAYVQYLSKIDKTFEPEKLDFGDERMSNAVKSFQEMPPVAPPAFHGKTYKVSKRGLGNHFGEVDMMKIQHQSGVDPIEGKFSEIDRLELHSRLTSFYRANDKIQLKKGIGEIVDLGLKKGEVYLNHMLVQSYGTDLRQFETAQDKAAALRQTQIEERISARQTRLQKKKDKTGSASIYSKGKEPNFGTARNTFKKKLDVEQLHDDLEKFFFVYDSALLAREGLSGGFAELIKYAEIRGLKALNDRLYLKYGKVLSDVDELRAQSVVSFGSESDTFEHQSTIETSEVFDPEMMIKPHEVNMIKLPPFVRKSLKMYYMKYDPQRFADGSVKKVYDWTQRNGLTKLNAQLKGEYGESLDEFNEEVSRLRTDLIVFYTEHDQEKLVEGIDKILRWGVKNGRGALSEKLLTKYGKGIDM